MTLTIDLYANANDSDITSFLGKHNVLRGYLWASTNYEHPIIAPTSTGNESN